MKESPVVLVEDGEPLPPGAAQTFREAAYPFTVQGGNGQAYTAQGLTKRELFAAMIAQGIVSCGYDPDAGDAASDDAAIAENAIGIADALLAALQREGGS